VIILYNAEKLIENLNSYADNYKAGIDLNLDEVFSDCQIAAEVIKTLKTSKHTQKRKRQRISAKNRKYLKQIDDLKAEIEILNKLYKGES
jgi:ribonuclease HI